MRNNARIFVPLLLAATSLSIVGRSPQADAIRTVDALQFLAAGMCLGVALTGMLARLRNRAN